MKSNLVRRLTPEEAELERKRVELGALEARLAERELDLNTLEAQLAAFERLYLRTVGPRYAELDEVKAQIAEVLASLKPKDRTAQQNVSEARRQAHESAQATAAAKASNQPTEFKPPQDLKKLYRELAKRVHPDLATDDKDRARRSRIMADVNLAYKEGNVERLQTILAEWEGSPDSVEGAGVGVDLVRIIRKIAQVQGRLGEIEANIARLKNSDLFRLLERVDEARAQGRDLLLQMVAELNRKIASAREHLQDLRAKADL